MSETGSKRKRQLTLYDYLTHFSKTPAQDVFTLTKARLTNTFEQQAVGGASPEEALARKLRLGKWQLPSVESYLQLTAKEVFEQLPDNWLSYLPDDALLNALHCATAHIYTSSSIQQNLSETGIMEESAMLAMGIATELFASHLVSTQRRKGASSNIAHTERDGTPQPALHSNEPPTSPAATSALIESSLEESISLSGSPRENFRTTATVSTSPERELQGNVDKLAMLLAFSRPSSPLANASGDHSISLPPRGQSLPLADRRTVRAKKRKRQTGF